MNQDTKIMIAVPTTGWVHYKTAATLTHIASSEQTAIVYANDRPHDRARNRLVRLFLQQPTMTHLLFVDSDIEPPLDLCQRLLALNTPVASGAYRILNSDGPVWAIAQKDTAGRYLLQKELPADPFEADGAGAGCLLIRRDVLESMPWPWFKWIENPDGSQMSEDIYFCKQLNDAGIRVSVDPACVCVHHKTVGL